MSVFSESLETRRRFCALVVSGIALLFVGTAGTVEAFEASIRRNADGTLTIHRAGGIRVSATSLRIAAKESRKTLRRTKSRPAARAAWEAALLPGL